MHLAAPLASKKMACRGNFLGKFPPALEYHRLLHMAKIVIYPGDRLESFYSIKTLV